MLTERREFPAVDVIEALKIFSQPELLETELEQVSVENVRIGTMDGENSTSTLVAPISQSI